MGRAGLLLVVICLTGCMSPPRPDVLLVTFDTTRYDRFGCTGDPTASTPNVDELAARGTLFARAFASVGLTLPSHTTILSGLEPLVHGVHNNGRFRVDDSIETLAERLSAQDYQTGAFVAAYVLDSFYNLNQGFDVYDDETERERRRLEFSVPTRPAEEVTDRALSWLADLDDERPFFLWAHYYDPHRPWVVDAGYEHIRDAYAAEIAYADAQFGRLLEAAGSVSDRDILVVFTADHGEGLGEHGEETHGILAYDSVLHVPLIVAGPGVPRGRRSEAYVRHADIVPTVLGALGQRKPEGLDGRDLIARAVGDDSEDSAVGYFESQGPHFDHGWAAMDGVRTARWKYTGAPEPRELYDLAVDRRELSNLVDVRAEIAREMHGRYEELRRSAQEIGRPLDDDDLDLERLSRLAALGYVDGGGRREGEEPDPRKVGRTFNWVDGARSAAMRGDYERAIETLETLRQSEALRPLVLRSLAPVYVESGRFEEAIAAYRDYIELTDAKEAKVGLAGALERAGRGPEALELVRGIEGSSQRLVAIEARLLAKAGRAEEARSVIDERLAGPALTTVRLRTRAELVIEMAPFDGGAGELRGLLAEAADDPYLESWLGYYLAVWTDDCDVAEARRLLEEAVEVEPENLRLLANSAWGVYRLGDAASAIERLEAVLAMETEAHLERFRLAYVLAEQGDTRRSRELAATALRLWPGAPWAADARELLARLDGAAAGAEQD